MIFLGCTPFGTFSPAFLDGFGGFLSGFQVALEGFGVILKTLCWKKEVCCGGYESGLCLGGFWGVLGGFEKE